MKGNNGEKGHGYAKGYWDSGHEPPVPHLAQCLNSIFMKALVGVFSVTVKLHEGSFAALVSTATNVLQRT